MKGRTWNFDYRYTIEPSGPGLVIAQMDKAVEKACEDCKKSFLGSRIAKRCPICREVAKERQQARANIRCRKKRQAEKEKTL